MTAHFDLFVTHKSIDLNLMRKALKIAHRAGLAGEMPIGAALVRGGEVISIASNTIISSLDVTAHAEVNVIRDVCTKERSIDLTGCELFTTVEPCPMCYAASHYAGIKKITFAATREDLHLVTGSEMQSGPRPEVARGAILRGNCMRSESLSLLQAWKERQIK